MYTPSQAAYEGSIPFARSSNFPRQSQQNLNPWRVCGVLRTTADAVCAIMCVRRAVSGMQKLLSIGRIGAAGIALILLFGFAIGTDDPMPGYAVVFVDDVARTFIALPCIEAWGETGRRAQPTS